MHILSIFAIVKFIEDTELGIKFTGKRVSFLIRFDIPLK
jgi:hypothetical protein